MSTTKAPPRSLGSKSRSFIPMTPRSLKPQSQPQTQISGRDADGQPPAKKFRSSAAPKGTKLASGYVDRAQERNKETEGDDRYERLKNLEKLLKDEEIDQTTFDKQREDLGIGGDVSSTHLVKGLDFKLLERVRRGEDINERAETAAEELEYGEPVDEADVDDELEKALERDVEAPSNKGVEDEPAQDAPEAIPAVALSRDEILRQMKERRKNPQASQAPVQPVLDQSRFKKLEPVKKSNKHKFTESINGRRREVLVITNKDGTTKRKTRWLDPEPDVSTVKNETAAWGSDLPEQVIARQKAAEEAARQAAAADDEDDGDIFGGVADYDPLAGLDSDSEAEDKPSIVTDEKPTDKTTETKTTSKSLKSTSTTGPRNYFTSDTIEENQTYDPRNDPSILAALKRAAQLRQEQEAIAKSLDKETPTGNPEDEARNRALLKKLQSQSGTDDIDMDMSFGGNGRFDDEEDESAVSKQKLSQWKGLGQENDDEEDDRKDSKQDKRKRGGKKKKGDKNSFADVMSVIEGRKK